MQSYPTARIITRAVWLLSLVSFFTDVASELLYPIMPLYLKSISFSVVFIGLLEGIAEAVAGLSKGYFGQLSDHMGRRKAFVQWGYGISAVGKPLLAVSIHPLWILFVRALERTGKGIRTGARDALLAAEASPQTRARVFGFHRSMDTLGAVVGPAAALVYLVYYPGQYRLLFLLAFIPGLVATLLTAILPETRVPARLGPRPKLFSFLLYLRQAPPQYRRLLGGLLLFTLFNSSDVFLLLRVKDAGLSDSAVIGVYIFYNLIYALAAYPAGYLADKLGPRDTLVSGLVLFAAVYAGMAISSQLWQFGLLFILYGLYAACTEGVAKAWITHLVPAGDRATALGTYAGLTSITALIASTVAGLLWYGISVQALFYTASGGTVLAALYLASLSVGTTELPPINNN